MRFQNGSNKVAIKLRVVQFWSEIILVISNHNYYVATAMAILRLKTATCHFYV